VIAVVREPFSRAQPRVFADHAISFDDIFLAGLIGNDPFPSPDRNRLDGLIVDRDKVNERIRPVRRRLECRHIDNLVDEDAEIVQFPKHGAHKLQCAILSEKSHTMETPVALSIAGSDSSGGAGIQADMKTFTYFKVYAQTVVTCVVAEVPGKVLSIQPVEPRVVRDQLTLGLAHFPVAAIKTGMLYSAEIIDLICDLYESLPEDRRPYLVIDPVMIATSGDALAEPGALERYKARMFSLADLVTPNLDETAAILETPVNSLPGMREAAVELYRRYDAPFLLKGGHLKSSQAVDILIDSGGLHEFSEPYRSGISTHGTGCTYSAAIAANLALGQPLLEAVRVSKRYVTRAITDSFYWRTKTGDTSSLRHFWP
jgi:hydroxymethylpyrimidine/phosphomethylpyrimidine kinase